MNYVQGFPTRPGPEASLVQAFIETNIPPCYKGESRFVFIEPKLGASRPDIVIVYWDSSVAASWPEERQILRKLDLRLAHLLFLQGPLAEKELRTIFPRGLSRSLEKLNRAKLVWYEDGLWHLRSLEEIFAVRRIMTFEAKVSSISRALEQAYFNTWFASKSYVLTPAKQPRAHTIEQARLRGVGIWLLLNKTDSFLLVDAEQRTIPQSYASWLFNELVWKASVGAIK